MIIFLRPKGKPDPGTTWENSKFHGVILNQEDDDNWYGTPADNLDCPELQYPKHAWEKLNSNPSAVTPGANKNLTITYTEGTNS